MNCIGCQREIADYSNFCYFCGRRQVQSSVAPKRLKRSPIDKKIAGVCSGLADYFDADPTIIRIIWAFATLATGVVPGILAYFAAWILMPEALYVTAAPAAANRVAPPGSPS